MKPSDFQGLNEHKCENQLYPKENYVNSIVLVYTNNWQFKDIKSTD